MTLTETKESHFPPCMAVKGFRLASDAKKSKRYRITVSVASNKAALGSLTGSYKLNEIRPVQKAISAGGNAIMFHVDGKVYTTYKSLSDRIRRVDKTILYKKRLLANVVSTDPSEEGSMLEVQLDFILPSNLKYACAKAMLKLELVLQVGDSGSEHVLPVEMPLYLHIHRDTRVAQAKDAVLSLAARYDQLPDWAQDLIKGGATLLIKLI